MAEFTASPAKGILSEIRRTFEKSPKEILTVVSDQWIRRFGEITEHKGECYHTD
jgi:hypothetical protein